MITLLWALAGPAQPIQLPPWWGGRVFTSDHAHVGVRPALYVKDDEIVVFVSVRVTLDVL